MWARRTWDSGKLPLLLLATLLESREESFDPRVPDGTLDQGLESRIVAGQAPTQETTLNVPTVRSRARGATVPVRRRLAEAYPHRFAVSGMAENERRTALREQLIQGRQP